MRGDYGLVDTLVNLPTPPGEARQQDPNIARWFHRSKALTEGATVEEMLSDLEEAGVEKGMLTYLGDTRTDELYDQACQRIAEACAKSNGRLYGLTLLDPKMGMDAVRRLERSVKEYGFVTAHLVPSVIGLPPTDGRYYPIYSKCIELGIPIRINVGVPGPMAPAHLQRSIQLDEILLQFPELTVVASHVGHPWHLETVAMLQKHPNLRLMTAGWAPKHVPQEIWHVANTRAQDKVMWASDYPLLPVQRAAEEGWDVPLKDEAKRRYLRDNAIEVFKLGA